MPWLSIARRDGTPGPEWRKSDWRETNPLHNGRECPRCKAEVCGGASWRAHWAWHGAVDTRLEAIEEAVRKLAAGVRELAVQAGHADWYAAPDEDEGAESDDLDERLTAKARQVANAPLTGFVIGSGELPPDVRAGGDE